MVEITERRRLEELSIQETKWKGHRIRTMKGGYKLLQEEMEEVTEWASFYKKRSVRSCLELRDGRCAQ